jgi:hypothetical protein
MADPLEGHREGRTGSLLGRGIESLEAQLGSDLAPVPNRLGKDDSPRAAAAGRQCCAQTDGASAHDEGLTVLRLRLDPARGVRPDRKRLDERAPLEWSATLERHGVCGLDDDRLGVRARQIGDAAVDPAPLAKVLGAVVTELALRAGDDRVDHHRNPGLEPVDRFPHLRDRAHDLVAHHHPRHAAGVDARVAVHIRAADPGGANRHAYVVGPDRERIRLLHREPARAVEDELAHRRSKLYDGLPKIQAAQPGLGDGGATGR